MSSGSRRRPSCRHQRTQETARHDCPSEDLKPSSAQLLWIIDIYGFMVAGFLVTMGTLGDRIGRRRLLLIGAGACVASGDMMRRVAAKRCNWSGLIRRNWHWLASGTLVASGL